MTFSSLTFLLIFLPLFLLAEKIVPGKAKNGVLLAGSLFFYAWGSPHDLVLLLLMTGYIYFAGLALQSTHETEGKKRKQLLLAAIAVPILVLAFYKYTTAAMPLGISFYTFSAISYLIDVYRADVEAVRNPVELTLYMSFFPKVVSGPITPFREMIGQIRERKRTDGDLLCGLERFFLGLCKKVLLADFLGASFAQIQALEQRSTLSALLGILFYSLQLYLDFSGYSDMAIGLSRACGFSLPRNFRDPYLATSPSDFWRRWHISLGRWFRDYVYIPLGGNRGSHAETIRNLLLVWILTGIWHGSTVSFLIWGLYHGAWIILEKSTPGWNREILPRWLRILATDGIVMCGWVFFFSPTLRDALAYFADVFGRNKAGIVDATSLYFLRGNLLILLLALLCCGPFLRTLRQRWAARSELPGRISYIGVQVLLLLLCIASLVAATNTTFLYARF